MAMPSRRWSCSGRRSPVKCRYCYHAHPAMVDGWLSDARRRDVVRRQTIGFRILRPRGDRTPFGFSRLRQGRVTVHAAVSRDTSSDAFVGTVRVFDAFGKLVADVEDVSLRRIEVPSGAAPDDWFYKVEWQRSETVASDVLAKPQRSLQDLVRGLEPTGAPEAYKRYGLLRTQLDDIAALHIVGALRQLGLPLCAGDFISAADMAHCPVLERHRALLARMMEILCEDGFLQRDSAGWRVLRTPDRGGMPELWQAIEQEFPEFAAETDVTRRCASELANVLEGKTDPLHLLFPNGSFAPLEATVCGVATLRER